MLLESALCQPYDKPLHSVKPGTMRPQPENPSCGTLRAAQQYKYMDICLFSKSASARICPPVRSARKTTFLLYHKRSRFKTVFTLFFQKFFARKIPEGRPAPAGGADFRHGRKAGPGPAPFKRKAPVQGAFSLFSVFQRFPLSLQSSPSRIAFR